MLPQEKFNAMLLAMMADDLDAVVEVVVVNDTQLTLDLFDYDEESAEYEDYMLDVEWLRTGC